MNSIIARTEEPLALSDIDPRFISDLPTDVRVVLDWDADNVDLDLWVTDPRGEKCYYQNNLTTIGGLCSADFTKGYGPEEFILKRSIPGKYKVEVNYYGDRRNSPTGPPTLFIKLITDYGRKNQKVEEIILRLEKESQVIEIGSFEFEG